jgi:hypothetical protein
MQLKEKSGIYLSCGVPAHAVKGKVSNIPELWHFSPCSQLKEKSGIYLRGGVTVHAVKVKVRNITELCHSSPCS